MATNKKASKKGTASKKATYARKWTEINGECLIFGREVAYTPKGKKKEETFIGYSTSVGMKQQDGEYLNAYLSVKFHKDTEPPKIPKKSLGKKPYPIQVTEGWLTVEKYKGECKVALFVREWEEVEESEDEDEDEDEEDDEEDDENDLPF